MSAEADFDGESRRNRWHRLTLALLGFGQDADGELYVLANETGTPFGDTGVVLRIASTRPMPTLDPFLGANR